MQLQELLVLQQVNQPFVQQGVKSTQKEGNQGFENILNLFCRLNKKESNDLNSNILNTDILDNFSNDYNSKIEELIQLLSKQGLSVLQNPEIINQIINSVSSERENTQLDNVIEEQNLNNIPEVIAWSSDNDFTKLSNNQETIEDIINLSTNNNLSKNINNKEADFLKKEWPENIELQEIIKQIKKIDTSKTEDNKTVFLLKESLRKEIEKLASPEKFQNLDNIKDFKNTHQVKKVDEPQQQFTKHLFEKYSDKSIESNNLQNRESNVLQENNEINLFKGFYDRLNFTKISSGTEQNTEKNEHTVHLKDLPEFLLKQINSKVKVNKTNGTSEISLKLKPEKLGKMVLRLTSQNGQVAVKILTENHHTRNLVEQNIIHLKQEFTQQGIKFSVIDVQVGNENSFEQFMGQQYNPFQQQKYAKNRFNKNFFRDEKTYSQESLLEKETISRNSALGGLELFA